MVYYKVAQWRIFCKSQLHSGELYNRTILQFLPVENFNYLLSFLLKFCLMSVDGCSIKIFLPVSLVEPALEQPIGTEHEWRHLLLEIPTTLKSRNAEQLNNIPTLLCSWHVDGTTRALSLWYTISSCWINYYK